MKKILIVLVMLASVVYATSETHTTGSGSSAPGYNVLRKVVIGGLSTSAITSATETTREICGFFHRIVIDQTGSDTSYNVRVQDENLFDIFNSTITANVDTSAVIVGSDTASTANFYAGVPVCGTLTISSRGCSSALTDLKVILYYLEYWK